MSNKARPKLLNERYVGPIGVGRTEYSAERTRQRMTGNGELQREQQLEFLYKHAKAMDFVGKNVDLCHRRNVVVGQVTEYVPNDQTRRCWVRYGFYDTPVGRIMNTLASNNIMCGISADTDEHIDPETRGTIKMEAVHLAVCLTPARDGSYSVSVDEILKRVNQNDLKELKVGNTRADCGGHSTFSTPYTTCDCDSELCGLLNRIALFASSTAVVENTKASNAMSHKDEATAPIAAAATTPAASGAAPVAAAAAANTLPAAPTAAAVKAESRSNTKADADGDANMTGQTTAQPPAPIARAANSAPLLPPPPPQAPVHQPGPSTVPSQPPPHNPQPTPQPPSPFGWPQYPAYPSPYLYPPAHPPSQYPAYPYNPYANPYQSPYHMPPQPTAQPHMPYGSVPGQSPVPSRLDAPPPPPQPQPKPQPANAEEKLHKDDEKAAMELIQMLVKDAIPKRKLDEDRKSREQVANALLSEAESSDGIRALLKRLLPQTSNTAASKGDDETETDDFRNKKKKVKAAAEATQKSNAEKENTQASAESAGAKSVNVGHLEFTETKGVDMMHFPAHPACPSSMCDTHTFDQPTVPFPAVMANYLTMTSMMPKELRYFSRQFAEDGSS